MSSARHFTLTASVVNRFWQFVEPMTEGQGCWEWSGSIIRGYGKLQIASGLIGGRAIQAHRVSYYIHHGDPGELFVCHRCDNKSCVNPTHLFLGTNADNINDFYAKFHVTPSICKRGHSEYVTRSKSRGSYCKACRRVGNKNA